MAEVLEAVPLGATGRKRQHRIEPVQSLNGGLLIHTEDGSMLRRIQVQPDDVSRFGFEIRIVAGHIPLQTMRLQTGFFPDAVHSILADTQFSSQFAAAPVCGTVLRPPAGGRENPRPQLRGEHRSRLTGMAGIQTVDAGSEEALLPSADGRSGGSQLPLNAVVRSPLRQHQDKPGTEDISSRQRTRLSNAAEFELLAVGENNRIAGHISLDVSLHSNVYSATVH